MWLRDAGLRGHDGVCPPRERFWIPACAGMTGWTAGFVALYAWGRREGRSPLMVCVISNSEMARGCTESSLPGVWGCPTILFPLPPRVGDQGGVKATRRQRGREPMGRLGGRHSQPYGPFCSIRLQCARQIWLPWRRPSRSPRETPSGGAPASGGAAPPAHRRRSWSSPRREGYRC